MISPVTDHHGLAVAAVRLAALACMAMAPAVRDAGQRGSVQLDPACIGRVQVPRTGSMPAAACVDPRAATFAALEPILEPMRTGDRAEAREWLQWALADGVEPLLEDLAPEDARPFLTSFASVARALGDFEGELVIGEELLQLLEAERGREPADIQRVRLRLGVLHGRLGRLDAARALIESVCADRERDLPAGRDSWLAARESLGVVCKEMGDVPAALLVFEEVHEYRVRTLPPDDFDLLAAKGNLAWARGAMGDLQGALELEERVHDVWEAHLDEGHADLLRAKENLAGTRLAMGDPGGARDLLEHVLEVRRRLFHVDHFGVLRAEENLAVARLELGDTDGARALLEHVRTVRGRTLPEGHKDRARADERLAMVHLAEGDPAAARELFERAAREFGALLPPHHPDLLRIQGSLAVARFAAGDVAAAESTVVEAAKTATGLVSYGLTASPREARALTRDVHDRLGRLRLCRDVSADSQETLARLFSAYETARHVATARLLVPAGAESERTVVLRTDLVRAQRLLDATLARDSRSPDGSCSRSAALENRRREIAALALARDARYRELLRELGRTRSLALEIDPCDVASSLADGDVAVGMTRVDAWERAPSDETRGSAGPRYMAFVLSSDGRIAEVDLGPAAQIEEAIRVWRISFGARIDRGEIGRVEEGPESELAAGRALRALLFDPLVEAAEVREGGRLYVCLDDALHTVPIDALPLDPLVARRRGEEDIDDALRIGDRYDVRLELSFARIVRPDPAPGGPTSVLAVGGIDFRVDPRAPVADSSAIPGSTARLAGSRRSNDWGNWDSLYSTRGEVQLIADYARDQLDVVPVVLGESGVTEASLRAAVPGKRFVHIATHAWFMPRTVKSMLDAEPAASRRSLLGAERTVTGFMPLALCGLVLSGANAADSTAELSERLLSAQELSTFDLAGCELAVLAACGTNVGIARAGQGIQSLQTGLHQAGARATMTSLWDVDDAATKELMADFYERLWLEGESKTRALWSAKCALRRHGARVREWAAWVLVGGD